MTSTAGRLLIALLASVLLFAGAAATTLSAAAQTDVIHLRNGDKVEGQIVREIDGHIWVQTRIGSIEAPRFFRPDEIREIERGVQPAGDAEDATRQPERRQEQARTPGVPRGIVLSLEGTVGIEMTAKAIEDVIPQLERDLGTDGQGVLVLKINSGGGLLLEVERLSDIIQNELKPRFRTVAWIESAISAAAMTAHCLEEIYFMPQGNYGAATAFSGDLVGVSGRDLEEILYLMERISARGGYDPAIMRSMQVPDPLSATIDPDTGEVTWRQDDEGEHLVNREGNILTFNAPQAERYRFSLGTAATLDELGRELGYQEIEWVGRPRSGLIYPVSRAEDQMISYRERVSEDQRRLREYQAAYELAVSMAQGAAPDRRGAFIGRARAQLNNIRRMVRTNPNFSLLIFGMEEREFRFWLEDQEEMLRNLMRR